MVGLCLGPYGGPGEVGVSYERGTPVPTLKVIPMTAVRCATMLYLGLQVKKKIGLSG